MADPRFLDVRGRVDNREALNTQLSAALASRAAAEWVEILGQAGLTVGRIRSYDDVLRSPEVAAGRSVIAGENADGSPVRLVRSPLRFRRWSDADLSRRVRALDADGPKLWEEFAAAPA